MSLRSLISKERLTWLNHLNFTSKWLSHLTLTKSIQLEEFSELKTQTLTGISQSLLALISRWPSIIIIMKSSMLLQTCLSPFSKDFRLNTRRK